MNKKCCFVCVGACGGGKSYWVTENNLEKFTLSADTLRCLFLPPDDNGITQEYNKEVWQWLYRLVEIRASKGINPIILDNVHSSLRYFNEYKKIVEKYSYEIVAVNFHREYVVHSVWNSNRPKSKQVPEDVVARMHKNVENMLFPEQGYFPYRCIPPEVAAMEIQKIIY